MSFPPPTQKQARIIWMAVTGCSIAALIALIVGLVWASGQVLQILSPVLWPLAVAGIIAYLLDPLVDRFEQKGLSRAKSIICVFGIALVIVGTVFGSVVPQLVEESRQLVQQIPHYRDKINTRIENWLEHPPPWVQTLLKRGPGPAPESVSTNETRISTTAAPETSESPAPAPPAKPKLDEQTMQSLKDWIATAVPKAGYWLFGQVGRVASWFGILVGLALVPVYTFYLLLEKQGIESRWTDYLPLARSSLKDEIVFVLRSINTYLITFFRGQVLVAICDGCLYTIGFLIIRLPYAALLGAAAIVLTIVPFLGAIIIFIIATIIAFVQFGDWLHPGLVLAVFAVVQTLEGFVISPKIMGDRVGLHPLTIIIAVMIGTTLLGGLLGGILAIPLTAVLRVLLARYVWKKPRKESGQREKTAG